MEQVHVHTDSEIVFRGICNHHTLPRALPTGPLAEMWHEFWGDWDKLHEAGTTVYVHKVAAHAREKGIQQDQVHTHGNEAADHWAGKGAMSNATPDQRLNIIGQIDAEAWMIQRRIMAIIKGHPREQIHPGTKIPVVRGNLTQDIRRETGHLPVKCDGKIWQCLACGITWRDRDRQAIRWASQCGGEQIWGGSTGFPNIIDNPWDVPRGSHIIVGGNLCHPSHHLGWLRSIVFCYKCGFYGQDRVDKLTGACRLKPVTNGQIYRRNRLIRGLHPTKPQWPEGQDGQCPIALKGNKWEPSWDPGEFQGASQATQTGCDPE